MILPATFAVGMGDAWRKSREKIEQHFDLEALIVSWDLSRLNFSENTNLQECIVIARKRAPRTAPKKNALFVALHKNPDTVDAALSVARSVARERERGETIGVIGEDAPSRAGRRRCRRVGAAAVFRTERVARNFVLQYAFVPRRGNPDADETIKAVRPARTNSAARA